MAASDDTVNPADIREAQAKGRSLFVLMPFDPSFDEVYVSIKEAAEAFGLTCARGDENSRSGEVLQMILDAIKASDLIIADLTGGNPNVFYETAFAHAHKATQKVILLAQKDSDVPFDLRALRYLRYDNNPRGRVEVREKLSPYISDALENSPGEYVETIHNSTERTRRLVADCRALLASGPAVLNSLVIRTYSGFTSLAICDEEIHLQDDRAYKMLLLEESNVTRKLIQNGAMFKAVLSTPNEKHLLETDPFGYKRLRWKRLNALLEGITGDKEDECLLSDRVQIVVSPVRNNHVAIFNDRLLYEGIKTRIGGGFDLNLRITHCGIVAAYAKAFDSFFEDAAQYTWAATSSLLGETTDKWKRRALLTRVRFSADGEIGTTASEDRF